MAQKEMLEWWGRHQDVALGGYTKGEIEDLTGRVPLLLAGMLEDGKKLNMLAPKLAEVAEQAKRFVDKMWKDLEQEPEAWER